MVTCPRIYSCEVEGMESERRQTGLDVCTPVASTYLSRGGHIGLEDGRSDFDDPSAINGTDILRLNPSGGRVGTVLPDTPSCSSLLWKSTTSHKIPCVKMNRQSQGKDGVNTLHKIVGDPGKHRAVFSAF